MNDQSNNSQKDQENDASRPENGRASDDLNNNNNPDAALEAARTDGEDEFETGEDGTDKYLAMEQPGVTYTHETDPTVNSDHSNYSGSNDQNTWNEEGGNSRNSDAFNQDDYILEDNVDLDEDQNQSISSDDDDFEETNERYTN